MNHFKRKGKNMMNVSDVYTVTIEDVNIFAKGVCHLDGMVVFVSDALAGEVCKIKIDKLHSTYAYASVIELVSSSQKRLIPSCYAYQECGGCAFLHTDISEENTSKENYVKNAFKKQGIDAQFEKIVCPVTEKYRNKVVLFFDGNDFGYMSEGTNTVCPHTSCVLYDDIFSEIASIVKATLKDKSLKALYMRKSHDSSEIMVCIVLSKDLDISNEVNALTLKLPQIKTVLKSTYKQKKLVLENADFEVLYGDGYIYDTLCGLKFRISYKSFYQINHACAELLYEKAISLATLDSNKKCADLFCGTGTIGIISASKSGAEVFGVEIVEDAIKDAKHNQRLNNVKNATFEAMDAGKFNKEADVAIIDPPRKGCNQLMIDTLLRLKPQKIVYISCNVDTMARDVKMLQNTYNLSSPVSIFNLFPRTSHVESVVCLTRK